MKRLMLEEIIKVPRFEERLGYYTTPERSKSMASIKGKNSKPELLLRKALWSKGIRYRTHVKNLPGKPDFAIKKYRLVIFIDGDFWHGYNWTAKRESIKANRTFWIPKIERNMQRDVWNNKMLEGQGFTVMRFWEHEIKKNLNVCVNQVLLYVEAVRQQHVPSKGW